MPCRARTYESTSASDGSELNAPSLEEAGDELNAVGFLIRGVTSFDAVRELPFHFFLAIAEYRHIIHLVPIREVGVIAVCHEGGITGALKDRVVCVRLYFISPALFGASTITRSRLSRARSRRLSG